MTETTQPFASYWRDETLRVTGAFGLLDADRTAAGFRQEVVAGFETALDKRVEGVVDALIASGGTFEQYGEPLNTDEKGIARLGASEIAWFRDPDGNILAVENR